MILTSVKPTNFRSFEGDAELVVEPEVTVLTGANDSGKSNLLKFVEHIFNPHIQITESDAYYDRAERGAVPFAADVTIGGEVKLSVAATSPDFVSGTPLGSGDAVVADAILCPGRKEMRTKLVIRGGAQAYIQSGISQYPRVVSLPAPWSIRDVIKFDDVNPVEKVFLEAAFGPGFNPDVIGGSSLAELRRRKRKAEDELNLHLEKGVGPSLGLEFGLEVGNEKAIHVYIMDKHRGHTPLSGRGAGVRAIVNVLGALVATQRAARHTILLYDEPEQSLHADAQHLLRRALEAVGRSPLVQVIYTTHSPSMINPMRPASLRLFRLAQAGSGARTEIDNRPYRETFQAVRVCLGITPADSLLYAPLAVIVEGPTEAETLDLLIRKLGDAGVSGFEDYEQVWSQAVIIEGGGDRITVVYRVVEAQNIVPVLFVDGDKKDKVARFAAERPDAPAVQLKGGTEFEQIIPRERYIGALADMEGRPELTSQAFDAWLEESPPPRPMMFSKLIQRWAEDQGLEVHKPSLMRRAIEATPVAEIDAEPFRELLGILRRNMA